MLADKGWKTLRLIQLREDRTPVSGSRRLTKLAWAVSSLLLPAPVPVTAIAIVTAPDAPSLAQPLRTQSLRVGMTAWEWRHQMRRSTKRWRRHYCLYPNPPAKGPGRFQKSCKIVEAAAHAFPLYELDGYCWGRCMHITRKHCNYALAGTTGPHRLVIFMLTAGNRATGGSLICKFLERTRYQ